ncbi:MAG TPA: aminodeoxychorismate synthase component I, partial [Caulobacteraceae bacterium]|nr:aminodeoxychorismate synthase component I [Caulobacteraceae bacterium]
MRAIAMIERPWTDPSQVLSAFADEPFAVALISGADDAGWSYVARAPEKMLSLRPAGGGDPVAQMQRLLGETQPAAAEGPPFQGGLIGLACYELGDRFESLALARASGWPDLICGLYPAVLAFDHRGRRVMAVGRGDQRGEARARAAHVASWMDAVAAPPIAGALA